MTLFQAIALKKFCTQLQFILTHTNTGDRYFLLIASILDIHVQTFFYQNRKMAIYLFTPSLYFLAFAASSLRFHIYPIMHNKKTTSIIAKQQQHEHPLHKHDMDNKCIVSLHTERYFYLKYNEWVKIIAFHCLRVNLSCIYNLSISFAISFCTHMYYRNILTIHILFIKYYLSNIKDSKTFLRWYIIKIMMCIFESLYYKIYSFFFNVTSPCQTVIVNSISFLFNYDFILLNHLVPTDSSSNGVRSRRSSPVPLL